MEEIEKKFSNKICSVVKDLLPLYKDDALREESREFVEEHLKECQECQQYKTNLEQMKENTITNLPGTITDSFDSEDEEAARMKKIASRLRSRRRKFVLAGLAVALFVYILFSRILQTGMIFGDSMEPTFQSGSNVMVNRLAYLVLSPDRGDVIFYRHNGGSYIKRIVGIPGDKVEIKDHQLLINDKPSKIKNIAPYIEDQGDVTYPVVLGEDEFFVLGDNLDSSQDSRFQICGNITEDEILGKVIGLSISMIKKTEYTYDEVETLD